jgi:hypothetical protein
LCASSSVYHHLYPTAISSALDRSKSHHQAYHRRHHGARRCPQPVRAHKRRPLSRPHCAMPLRLVVGYAVDEHHYASCLHQPALLKKRCSQEVERRQSVAIVRSRLARSEVSPGAAQVSSRRLHRRCLQQGHGAEDTAIALRDRGQGRILTSSLASPIAASTRCGIIHN